MGLFKVQLLYYLIVTRYLYLLSVVIIYYHLFLVFIE